MSGKLIINLVLVLVIFGLVYVLYSSIREPIAFQAELSKRKTAVIDKLIMIRSAQELYRDVSGGSFANDFDSLKHIIRTGKVQVISVYGDPDDPENTEAIRYDTTYDSAIEIANERGIRLDSIELVPYGKGATFDIAADTISYQKTVVNVVEVGVPMNKFMGVFADERFARYDRNYDPNFVLKFGNMNAPNTAGNWER